MIVLRSPKGWTGPKEVDGKKTEGFWRSHQVPLGELHENPAHVGVLENWMKSYRPDELFDSTGRLNADLAALAPAGERRMGANPHANGGLLLKDLDLPDFSEYAVDVASPGSVDAEATRIMGSFLRDVLKLQPRRRATFDCSVPTRTTRTAGRTCFKSRIARGTPTSIPSTITSPSMGE